jgi:hypothetical protein
MPNWSTNRLTVYSPSSSVIDLFIDKARGFPQDYPPSELEKDFVKDHVLNEPPKEQALCFHALVPIPDEILKVPYSPPPRGTVKEEEDYPCGFNKEHELWGVKWGARDSQLELKERLGHGHSVSYSFMTPWGPPVSFLENVSRDWPNTILYLSWWEEDRNRGRIIVSDEEAFHWSEHFDGEMEDGESEDDYSERVQTWMMEPFETHTGWIRRMVK